MSSNSLGIDAEANDGTVDFDVGAEPWVADALSQIQIALNEVRVSDICELTVERFIGLTGPDTPTMSMVFTKD